MSNQYLVNQVKTTLTSHQIEDRIHALSKQIVAEYQGKEVILVGILKGAFIFLADLSRSLWQAGLTDYEIDFMGISSYGQDTETSRNPKITKDLDTDIRHRHVLIVEDIVDTGYSLDALIRLLSERQPASIKTAVLLSKSAQRRFDIHPEYVGFEVEGWVEGYGLDTAEKYRGRPEVVVRQT